MRLIRSILLLSIVLSITAISCKKNTKKEPLFSIEPKTISVKWTGYKTTDKVAVNGEFKEIAVTNVKEAPTAVEALNGAEFSIPVSSLFTNEPVRDEKLKTLFFGVMVNTLSLTGTLNLEIGGSGTIALNMNGIKHEFPISYIVSGQLIEIEGTLNLDDWNAQDAIKTLNEACFDLHTGPDGVSKTWNETAVKAVVYLKKN